MYVLSLYKSFTNTIYFKWRLRNIPRKRIINQLCANLILKKRKMYLQIKFSITNILFNILIDCKLCHTLLNIFFIWHQMRTNVRRNKYIVKKMVHCRFFGPTRVDRDVISGWQIYLCRVMQLPGIKNITQAFFVQPEQYWKRYFFIILPNFLFCQNEHLHLLQTHRIEL